VKSVINSNLFVLERILSSPWIPVEAGLTVTTPPPHKYIKTREVYGSANGALFEAETRSSGKKQSPTFL
jgi:hypothetical protein